MPQLVVKVKMCSGTTHYLAPWGPVGPGSHVASNGVSLLRGFIALAAYASLVKSISVGKKVMFYFATDFMAVLSRCLCSEVMLGCFIGIMMSEG